MRRFLLTLVLVSSLGAMLSAQAQAQAQGGGGAGGGGGGFGGGGGGLGAGGAGGGGAGGGGGGSGTFGSRSMGASQSPGSRSLSGRTTQNANAGQVSGNERFLRQNRQGGRNFVGSDTGDLNNFLSGLAGQQAGRSGLGAGRNGQSQGDNAGQESRQRLPVRVVVAFDYSAVAPTQLSTTLGRRLTRSKMLRSLSPVRVEVTGRTAILRGVVATEHDREVAEQVALLEVGISEVQNELKVGPARARRSNRPTE